MEWLASLLKNIGTLPITLVVTPIVIACFTRLGFKSGKEIDGWTYLRATIPIYLMGLFSLFLGTMFSVTMITAIAAAFSNHTFSNDFWLWVVIGPPNDLVDAVRGMVCIFCSH